MDRRHQNLEKPFYFEPAGRHTHITALKIFSNRTQISPLTAEFLKKLRATERRSPCFEVLKKLTGHTIKLPIDLLNFCDIITEYSGAKPNGTGRIVTMTPKNSGPTDLK
jgi:hypothetical protein